MNQMCKNEQSTAIKKHILPNRGTSVALVVTP